MLSNGKRELIKRLEAWFCKPLKGDQYEIFLSRVASIPDEAFAAVVARYIDDNSPSPAKFPTPNKILEMFDIWKKENPNEGSRFVVYDKNEDYRFPVELLWRGYNLLTSRGHQAFATYAASVGMPAADIERVRCKAAYKYQLSAVTSKLGASTT